MKFFRFLGMAVIAVCMCANFTACSKDGDGSEGGGSSVSEKKLVRIVYNYGDSGETYKFSYDKQGRVVESQCGDEYENWKSEYIWGNNTLQVDTNYSRTIPVHPDLSGTSEYSEVYTIENGLVLKCTCEDEVYYYSYDNTGRWNKDMTWDGDKLILEYKGDNKYKYNYTGLTCKKGYLPNFNVGEPLFIAHPELVGIQTKLLPTSATYTNFIDPSIAGGTVNYKYEFDSEGYISKITEKYDDGETVTYTLTWE